MCYNRIVLKGRLTSNQGLSHQSGQFREAWSELTSSEGVRVEEIGSLNGREAGLLLTAVDPSQKHL